MKRRSLRMAVMATLLGSLSQFGCINLGNVFGDGFWTDLGRSAIFEFIWDNDTTLDFFGDDGPGLIT